jgi:molybdate transport system ATP-binding protein
MKTRHAKPKLATSGDIGIRLYGMSLHRNGVKVLQHVDWQLRSGERWLVVGENGAGKTQFLKVLAGDVWPDECEPVSLQYFFQDEFHDTPHALREEIAWIGPERQDRYEHYGWNYTALQVVGTGIHRSDIPLDRLTDTDHAQCLKLLRSAGIGRLAKRHFLELSYGERRLVLVMRAIASRPALLLMDEAMSGLDELNRDRLRRLLASPQHRKLSWVWSAHRAADLPRAASHLLWLENGAVRFAGRFSRKILNAFLQVAPAAGTPRLRVRQTLRHQSERERESARELVLSNASVWLDGRKLLTGLNLVVHRGECWVIHGANGSGKTTLLRTLYGSLSVAHGGSLWRRGIEPGVSLEEFRAHTALVAPHLQADTPRYHAVLDTVVSGLHSSVGLNQPVTASERRRALATLTEFGIASLAACKLGELSYGQVRRVLFARAMVLKPTLLLLDEPFAGLDRKQREYFLLQVERCVRTGVTIAMTTHYRSEWPCNTSHELQLSKGKIAKQGRIRS